MWFILSTISMSAALLSSMTAILHTGPQAIRPPPLQMRWRWTYRVGRERGAETSGRQFVPLSQEEMAHLIETTEKNDRREYKLPSLDRAMLYRIALDTGFRAGELRSLTPGSFHLSANHPTVTVAAAYSKRRKEDVQLISIVLAKRLRNWLIGKPTKERLFARLPKHTARMMRCD